MSKRPKILFPSIEVPTQDVRSLQSTVQSLKEAVEILSGQRGPSPMASMDDIDLLQQRVYALESSQAWRVIYRNGFNALSGSLVIPDLLGYRFLRLNAYLVPDTVASAVWMQFSSDNGASFVQGAADYQDDYMYTQESATVNGAHMTGAGINLSTGVAVLPKSSNAFGFHMHDFVISNFNTIGAHKVWNGHVSFYDGSVVKKGQLQGRSNTAALSNPVMNAINLFVGSGSTVFSGFVSVEGIVG